jgi:hypothetical protein
VSYTLLLSLIEFKTLVMRDQLSDALGLLPNIPTGDDGLIARTPCTRHASPHTVALSSTGWLQVMCSDFSA